MRRLVAFGLVALFAVPVAWSQNASAPDPTASQNILYAGSNSADDRAVGWMNTDPADPANDQTSVGGAVQMCDPIAGLVCLPQTEGIDWTWTWTLTPALRVPLHLAAGTVRIVAFLGAGTGTGSGIEVTTQLAQGSVVIAEGPMQEHAYEGVAAGTPYQSLAWDLEIPATTLIANEPLVWTVRAVADTGETEGNFFMSVSDARGRSRIELPIASAAVAPQALADGPVTIRETVANVTTAAFLYRWNGTAEPFEVGYRSEGNGSVTFMVVDAANQTLLQQSVDGTGNGTKSVNGTAGIWTLAVRLDAFAGNFTLTIRPPPASSTTTSVSSSSGTTTSTTTSDSDGEKGAPGVAIPALVGLLATAALVTRRRRQ